MGAGWRYQRHVDLHFDRETRRAVHLTNQVLGDYRDESNGGLVGVVTCGQIEGNEGKERFALFGAVEAHDVLMALRACL